MALSKLALLTQVFNDAPTLPSEPGFNTIPCHMGCTCSVCPCAHYSAGTRASERWIHRLQGERLKTEFSSLI